MSFTGLNWAALRRPPGIGLSGAVMPARRPSPWPPQARRVALRRATASSRPLVWRALGAGRSRAAGADGTISVWRAVLAYGSGMITEARRVRTSRAPKPIPAPRPALGGVPASQPVPVPVVGYGRHRLGRRRGTGASACELFHRAHHGRLRLADGALVRPGQGAAPHEPPGAAGAHRRARPFPAGLCLSLLRLRRRQVHPRLAVSRTAVPRSDGTAWGARAAAS